ncbi:thiamine pyrophosphate-dependent enzyme [Spirillospora sp. NPDC047279]|uniref:thiamine pyrophosphate-dependent enzyme n=1 Tax=Spirillospora sp. NPDC047279 TaxID=3155478 RepID=UPI0033E707F8
MSAAGHVTRAELAGTVLGWTARGAHPLVVGNGFLSREVMAAGDGDHVLYLLAGMGLAPAVAAGLSLARGVRAVALEGDGNHLMGLPGTATIGLTGVRLTHVVHWNGGWESTGGQRVFGPGRVHDIGRAFGYATTEVVTEAATLGAALDRSAAADGPALVHVVGAMGDPVPPRTGLTMPGVARRFQVWLRSAEGDPERAVQ